MNVDFALVTPRLLLRRWRPDDAVGLAEVLGDAAVTEWLAMAPLDRAAAAARVERFEKQFDAHGMGPLAVEVRATGALAGYCGLLPVGVPAPAPRGVEALWALGRSAWGYGYAIEAARAVLADGFERLDLADILAFTARTNLRSQRVMQGAGMTRAADLDFDHPRLAEDHPLRAHVVYRVSRP
jgi:RimJ/RimL family protein N-acetyltransferase